MISGVLHNLLYLNSKYLYLCDTNKAINKNTTHSFFPCLAKKTVIKPLAKNEENSINPYDWIFPYGISRSQQPVF